MKGYDNMKKSLALIMSLIMIFSTFSVCAVSASAATAAPAAVSTQAVELENDFSLIFKGMFREILNGFMKRFGAKKGFYVTGVDITQSKTSVDVNNSVQLKATLEPENVKDNSITWQIEDSSIATVNANGVVMGRKAGSTKVYAIANGGFHDSCIVNVNNKNVPTIPCTDISNVPNSVEIETNGTKNYKISLSPSNTTDTVRIDNSNPSVIGVYYKDGTITISGKGEGSSIITVTCGNIIKKMFVTVEKA
jgi:uncharacterized protein YjdB